MTRVLPAWRTLFGALRHEVSSRSAAPLGGRRCIVKNAEVMSRLRDFEVDI
jgi:hypothetical protein